MKIVSIGVTVGKDKGVGGGWGKEDWRVGVMLAQWRW